jgi:hypothetical protein
VDLPSYKRLGPFVFQFYEPGERCMPLFMGQDTRTDYGPLVIFGMPFFTAYATTFDRTNRQLSITSLAHAPKQLCDRCDTSIQKHETKGRRASGAHLDDRHEQRPSSPERPLRAYNERRASRGALKPQVLDGELETMVLADVSSQESERSEERGRGEGREDEGSEESEGSEGSEESEGERAAGGDTGGWQDVAKLLIHEVIDARPSIELRQLRLPWWSIDPAHRPHATLVAGASSFVAATGSLPWMLEL